MNDDQFVAKGMMLLHKQAAEEVEKRLQMGEPAQAVADVVMSLVRNIENTLGNDLEPDVVIHGAVKLLMQVLELREAITKEKTSEAIVSEALKMFFQQYFENELAAGRVTPEELSELQNMSGDPAMSGAPSGPMPQGVQNGGV